MKIQTETFTINDYLNRTFACDCHKEHTIGLEKVAIQDHVDRVLLDYLHEKGFQHLYLIEDEASAEAYGNTLEAFLTDNGIVCDKVVLEKEVVPNEKAVFSMLVNIKEDTDCILGIGSGTLNDLSKFISYKLGMDYIIMATAPSMDGYASVGAALITDSLKTTYDCHVPIAIFGELDVLCQAPIDMIKAGMGDILGKYNCLVDWKVAHIINEEYYCPTIVDMVYRSIDQVVKNADGILTRDKEAIRAITEGLIITGIAMGFVGNSRPASGSEHHISHYWEMKFLFADKPPVFHGIKVGIATPGVIAMYKELAKNPIDFNACRERVKAFNEEAWKQLVLDRFESAANGVLALEEKAGKNNIEKALRRLDIIEEKWDAILDVIQNELPDPAFVTDLLKKTQSPYLPAQVDIDDTLVKDSVILAKEVRVRYGLLQLLWDLGLSEKYSQIFLEYYQGC